MRARVAGGLLASGADRQVPARLADLIGADAPVRYVDDLPGDVARAQWGERFTCLVWWGGLGSVAAHEHRLALHNLAAHLEPAGHLALADHRSIDELAEPCGLVRQDRVDGWVVLRRVDRVTIHDLVHAARQRLERLEPAALAAALAADPSVVVLDTRTPTDRDRTGVIPGSIHAPRTTLEWQCDPASGYANPEITSFEQRLVVVCNGGYSSSLAAASLQDLGFSRATDLVGGIDAWIAAGLPLVPPDSTHLS